jgi:D-beta-D-heptose 7-phosphate kinase/D-beta-D-heptose 1-phosphate adenosyltransferase
MHHVMTFRDDMCITARKVRVVSLDRHQQLIRMDHENTAPLDSLQETELLKRVHSMANWAEAIVLSDNQKGVVTELVAQGIIELARVADIPVVVDLKGEDSRYRYADLKTPNQREAEIAVDIQIRSGQALRRA